VTNKHKRSLYNFRNVIPLFAPYICTLCIHTYIDIFSSAQWVKGSQKMSSVFLQESEHPIYLLNLPIRQCDRIFYIVRLVPKFHSISTRFRFLTSELKFIHISKIRLWNVPRGAHGANPTGLLPSFSNSNSSFPRFYV